MKAQHKGLADGGWRKLSLVEQLGNVGSEVGRARRWSSRDRNRFDRAMVRALELIDLTLSDPRWRGRLRELTRTREILCDAWLGGPEYGSEFESLDRHFLHFAVAARKRRV